MIEGNRNRVIIILLATVICLCLYIIWDKQVLLNVNQYSSYKGYKEIKMLGYIHTSKKQTQGM